ncbi:MAG: response regulator [Chloroflexota bacterium]
MDDLTAARSGEMIERERAFDDLLDFLAREAVTEMDADRSSIFLLDEARRELWTRVALGLDGVIRIPADRGIVGHVTTTGELLNVADPYADTRFNPQVDRDTGYRTRSILCGPLRAPDGRIVGALQVLNKRGGGPFLAIDVKRFERVASRCALEIERARTFDALQAAEAGGAQVTVRSPKVLVAERDVRAVNRIREVLQDELTVLHASDTAELVRLAQDEQPDVILISVVPDGYDGVTACKILRSAPALADTPIIILTQAGHPEQVVAAIEAGASDYLIRPFSPAQVRAKTHTWLLRTGNAPTT